MSIEASITFSFAIFVFAITPGPGTFALIGRALMSGAGACFSMALGMAISDIIYLILATVGLAAIAENYGNLFTVIRLIGAAYLIYLGWKMWTAVFDTEYKSNKPTVHGWMGGFMQGFLISASNPKVILFYIAFLPTFIDLTLLEMKDVILVSTLTLVVLTAGLMLVSFAAASVRHYFRSEKGMRYLNRGAGSIMIGAGLYLASRGAGH